MQKGKVLRLTLKREYFAQIANKQKQFGMCVGGDLFDAIPRKMPGIRTGLRNSPCLLFVHVKFQVECRLQLMFVN
jgi:hypothetical protein